MEFIAFKMTSAEFKAARHKLGLTLSQLANIVNTEPRTIRKWEDGDGNTRRDPNPVACRVMRWMLDGYRPPEWPSGSDK